MRDRSQPSTAPADFRVGNLQAVRGSNSKAGSFGALCEYVPLAVLPRFKTVPEYSAVPDWYRWHAKKSLIHKMNCQVSGVVS
jgi:hypothetical protein